jgi:CheY-like chemotaxis protein
MTSILVVDDKPDIVTLVKMIFEAKGYDVHTATNGLEALALLQDTTVSLVLMDLMMPEMNGYEALDAIRADDRLKGIPVVACTARASKQDEARVMAAGFDGYISKPFRVQPFEASLAKYLGPKE